MVRRERSVSLLCVWLLFFNVFLFLVRSSLTEICLSLCVSFTYLSSFPPFFSYCFWLSPILILVPFIFPAMLSRPSFEDCATLARAYELDTPTEWAPVIYSHTITATNSTATTSPKRSEGTDFLSEYLLAYPAGYAVVFTELARRYRADPQKAQKAHAMTYETQRMTICSITVSLFSSLLIRDLIFWVCFLL